MDFQKEPHDRIIIHTDPCLPYFEHCSFGREPISPNLLGDVLSDKRENGVRSPYSYRFRVFAIEAISFSTP